MQAVVEEEEEHESAGAQRHASSVVRTIAFLFCSDFCCKNKSILFRKDTSGRVWTLLLHTDAQTWHGRRRTRPT